jgi:hypothetical protein
LLPVVGTSVEVSCHLYHDPVPAETEVATVKS